MNIHQSHSQSSSLLWRNSFTLIVKSMKGATMFPTNAFTTLHTLPQCREKPPTNKRKLKWCCITSVMNKNTFTDCFSLELFNVEYNVTSFTDYGKLNCSKVFAIVQLFFIFCKVVSMRTCQGALPPPIGMECVWVLTHHLSAIQASRQKQIGNFIDLNCFNI